MFSHVFLGIRDSASAGRRRLGAGAWALGVLIGLHADECAHAEQITYMGELQFAPGASTLVAEQRQTLDQLTRRRHTPGCVALAVSRSGGPVTALTTLERERTDYVARLFALRGVKVVNTGIRWRFPGEAITAAWHDVVTWGEERCPGTAPGLGDPNRTS